MGYYWGQELYHYGVKRRSGRYPYGSGDRPFQDRINRIRENNRARNISVAKQRLNKRIENRYKIAKVDKYAGKISARGYKKFKKTRERAEDIKRISEEILKDEHRLNKLGAYTIRKRIMGTSLATATTSGVYGFGLGWMLSTAAPLLPAMALAAGPALPIAALGYKYLKNTTQ